ncbi:MAG: hypothetical protein ACTSQ8_17455 [Candidatus Helarchaeota archaeon]
MGKQFFEFRVLEADFPLGAKTLEKVLNDLGSMGFRVVSSFTDIKRQQGIVILSRLLSKPEAESRRMKIRMELPK